MANLPDMFVPQLGVGIQLTESGDEVMMMTVETASTQFQFYLCTKANHQEVADQIRNVIIAAGKEMKQPKPALITNVKELPDGLRKTKR